MKALYFGAEFCQPCKTYRPRFIKACEEKGIEYNIYDAEHNEDKFTEFGVRNVPTVILVNDDGTSTRGTAADMIQLI